MYTLARIFVFDLLFFKSITYFDEYAFSNHYGFFLNLIIDLAHLYTRTPFFYDTMFFYIEHIFNDCKFQQHYFKQFLNFNQFMFYSCNFKIQNFKTIQFLIIINISKISIRYQGNHQQSSISIKSVINSSTQTNQKTNKSYHYHDVLLLK